MLHLDEGTVHAWLDGELSPDDAESAARHVATCAECQTRVAEARGLMAGASRIVSALDAGPAGVIPPAQPGPRSSRRTWRRFALTPMRMSIAATIVVAVGVTITARRVADNSAVHARMIGSPINAATPTVAASASTDSVSATAVGRPTGKLKAPTRAPSPIASAKADMSSPKPVASPAPQVSDAAALAQKAAPADKRAVTDSPRQVAAAPPVSEPPPRAARLDSLRAKDEMAKVAVDSLSRGQVERRQTTVVAGSATQLRGIAANQRDAEPTSVVVLRECYRLAVDSTDWRGVLPSGFALDLASSTLRTSGQVAGAGAGGGAGGGAGPGAAPKAAAQPANTLLQFSSPAKLNPVHATAPNGRLDSRVIGFWFAVRADTIGVRFASADPGKAITVLLTGGSNARVLSSDRTDSVRVARAPCVP
jgi:hypothetical protein